MTHRSRHLLAFLLLAGCGKEGRSRITAVARLDPPLTTKMLTLSVREENREWVWRGSDFRSSLELPTPTTPEREIGTQGNLQIGYRLETAGAVVSEGSVTLPARPDWGWTVQVVSATADPRQACFDCDSSKAFALVTEYRGPERDSVWLLWGGRSTKADTAEKAEKAD